MLVSFWHLKKLSDNFADSVLASTVADLMRWSVVLIVIQYLVSAKLFSSAADQFLRFSDETP